MRIISITLLLCLAWAVNSYSQNFEQVDSIVKTYPKSFLNPEALAKKINKDFSDTLSRARAIYTWMGLNIRYDVKAYYSKKSPQPKKVKSLQEKWRLEQKHHDKVVRKAIYGRKAVCDGYSRLFKDLCGLTGVGCEIIIGQSKTTTKDLGKFRKQPDHAWNLIELNGKKYLVDATWGAGSVDEKTKKFHRAFSGTYFMTEPEKFSLNHYPYDSSRLYFPRSKENFKNLPLYYPDYIKDSIEFKMPQTGILSLKAQDVVVIELKADKKPVTMRYILSYEKNLNKCELVGEENGIFRYEIPIKNVRNSYLTIYKDGRAMVTYKIVKS